MKTHGLSKHPLYNTWNLMRYRCQNSNANGYNRYGGRGIKVCERWDNSVATFIEDMWPTYQPGLTLDRINNDGNYEPDNVRWATRKQQGENQWQYNKSGDNNPRAKLTESQVRLIRWLKGQLTQQEVANLFHITSVHIGNIQNRKAWAHV